MSLSTRPAPPAARTTRLAALDVLRGVAIIAVIAFHLTWDLGSLDLIGVDIGRTTWGRWIAHGIAGTFLLLVGVSLVLAHRERFRAQAFWRREVELVGYAALISAVTYVALPTEFVSFGILHSIALTSVIALPFVWASRATALGAAGLALVLPQLIVIDGSSRWWSWTGLTESVKPTIDSAPVLPMLAVTLLGILLMRRLQDNRLADRLALWRAEDRLSTGLRHLGRHTLVIYLVHQPLLLGALHGFVWLRG
ncbi:DUF1624 domain-containing protein [Luteipulveratus halotolerans]|uniref:Heparan-alpha-glucosaminide N-acetyltransferase catalytic domain-containing protein n=1 Tax=Luteipulveratus halotolerans TaxID=1631356 RepID=A0A0L6CHP0_9MICO|nr:heparan-alpha-glucosaminide N-acetyltransferase [Luteipulveratus halotolerans]KNX37317.1 hypothetical protein VV01_09415 [Luteipulveratus halotolerans]